MPNESPQQRTASQLHEDRRRCQEAARRWRTELGQGRYRGMPTVGFDDLTYVAAILDSAALELDRLPRQTRSDVMHLVGRLLDDAPRKQHSVAPLTDPRGDGH